MKNEVPNKENVIALLEKLVTGEISRNEATKNVEKWLLCVDVKVENETIWDIIEYIGAADLISTDRPFLYTLEDYSFWLEKLKNL